jgi:hypothetical protein
VNPVSEILHPQNLPSSPSDAPSSLYRRIQKIAVEGLRDVENFKQSWSSLESQALWKRTVDGPFPQGSDVWRVDYVSALKHSKTAQHRASGTEIPNTDPRDTKDIIEDFCKKHPSTRLESQDSVKLIPFNIRIASMTFRVVSSVQGNVWNYEVQYSEGSKATQMQDGILRHLNQRHLKSNLESLLVSTKPKLRFTSIFMSQAEHDDRI